MNQQQIKTALDSLLEAAGHMAHQVLLKEHESLMPTWLYLRPNGELGIIATPWRDELEKEIMVLRVREELRATQALLYAFVTEAWVASAPSEWSPGKQLPLRPSQHPDRQEVVIAFATDGQLIEWKSWDTKRDYHEQIIALAARKDFEGTPESWLTRLLNKE
jgi:hypothetical protein